MAHPSRATAPRRCAPSAMIMIAVFRGGSLSTGRLDPYGDAGLYPGPRRTLPCKALVGLAFATTAWPLISTQSIPVEYVSGLAKVEVLVTVSGLNTTISAFMP